ncbi:NAD-dependent malic enzyme 2, mitochondrial-like isoform X5 [Arachis ipaensis]|uniref:NAD-dependent malic enzyme 2, mitochondrial-like isoform X5 n=1 Tax=Arachis ipaensis TaxID=130454 RepID=UPI000A2B005A|nr:NAD-dependent malic enzyme 2, mitochondrial-like isoform X5 [Arachis ipaensis]
MKESVSTKPAIFAMSSPTMNAECIAIDAFKHAGGDIVFRSGSPFENVDLGNGKVGHVNQANNMYLFLGLLLNGIGCIQRYANPLHCILMTIKHKIGSNNVYLMD